MDIDAMFDKDLEAARNLHRELGKLLKYSENDHNLPISLDYFVNKIEVEAFVNWWSKLNEKVNDFYFLFGDTIDYSKRLETFLNDQRGERDMMDETGHKRGDF